MVTACHSHMVLVEDVWKFVEANGDQLDAAIDYSRDLGYDYFGASDDYFGWLWDVTLWDMIFW